MKILAQRFYKMSLNRRKTWVISVLKEKFPANLDQHYQDIQAWRCKLKLMKRYHMLPGRLHKFLFTAWHRWLTVQLSSGSVTLKSVLFDNFARFGRNKKMILRAINWKTLSSYLRMIALAFYLGHSVNQIYIRCCELGIF